MINTSFRGRLLGRLHVLGLDESNIWTLSYVLVNHWKGASLRKLVVFVTTRCIGTCYRVNPAIWHRVVHRRLPSSIKSISMLSSEVRMPIIVRLLKRTASIGHGAKRLPSWHRTLRRMRHGCCRKMGNSVILSRWQWISRDGTK